MIKVNKMTTILAKYHRNRLTDKAENALIKAGCYNLNDKRMALQILTELRKGVQDHDKLT